VQWKIACGHRSKPHIADGDEGARTRRNLDTVRSELAGRAARWVAGVWRLDRDRLPSAGVSKAPASNSTL
jgi:hypothetical protein